MPTVGVFSDSSRFKLPLDTAGGSYDPFVIFPFADGDLEPPEKPEYSHMSWSPPKQTEPVGDTFALGVSSDDELHLGTTQWSQSELSLHVIEVCADAGSRWALWSLQDRLVGKEAVAKPIVPSHMQSVSPEQTLEIASGL